MGLESGVQGVESGVKGVQSGVTGVHMLSLLPNTRTELSEINKLEVTKIKTRRDPYTRGSFRGSDRLRVKARGSMHCGKGTLGKMRAMKNSGIPA